MDDSIKRAVAAAARLTLDATAEEISAVCQRIDPNGSYTAERAALDHADPLTAEEAWDALAALLEDVVADAGGAA